MTKILGLIPARGGSKRLPRKNVKDFLGRPLISWTIDQAKKSRLLDKVIVSTDDEEIAEVAKRYGAEVPFLRPGELAKDNSPTIDAVIHTLDWFEEKGEHFDIVAILEPTSPLRKDDDIDKAAGKLIDNLERADCVVSVGSISHELPFFTMKVTKEGYIAPFSDNCTGFGNKNYANMVIEDIYFPYGGIYITKNETLRKYGTIYQKRLMPHFVEKWQNYEMDDIYDYLCIEAVAKHRSLGAK